MAYKCKPKRFKVWDRIECCWVDLEKEPHLSMMNELAINLEGGLIAVDANDNYDFRITNNNRFVKIEYTGHDNKNGVEIYEGSIMSEKVVVDGKEVDSVWPVFWSKKMGWVVDISFSKDGSLGDPLLNYLHCDVIGNVLNRPDLVK